jgi:aspartate-semialdehyde dehydrogenase
MENQKKYRIVVVGATGNAGMETIRILKERDFPATDIVAVASDKSAGKAISFMDQTMFVRKFTEVDFSEVDVAFFCAGSEFSRKNAEAVTNAGCIIIDKTSCFRLNPRVPLVIPEVNLDVLKNGTSLGIISTPNCVAVPLAMTLKALATLSPVERAVVSTYQSVSGAGRKAVDELCEQTKEVISGRSAKSEIFPKQIAFNVIPAVGDIYSSGISDEEEKISGEICKILSSPMRVAVTCARVPVFIGHAMSVACEFSFPIGVKNAYDAFEKFNGIVTVDARGENPVFATSVDAQGKDEVFVSRIRRDISTKNGLIYWVVTDNLRKGAALNSVQIAEYLISKDPTLQTFMRDRTRNSW